MVKVVRRNNKKGLTAAAAAFLLLLHRVNSKSRLMMTTTLRNFRCHRLLRPPNVIWQTGIASKAGGRESRRRYEFEEVTKYEAMSSFPLHS